MPSAWNTWSKVSAYLLYGAKTSSRQKTVTAADFHGLRKLRAALGGRFVAGMVLYDEEVSACFGDRPLARPLRTIWEAT